MKSVTENAVVVGGSEFSREALTHFAPADNLNCLDVAGVGNGAMTGGGKVTTVVGGKLTKPKR
ncbi:hypothetical protein A2U01_0055848 [Trifolium medium]|uniref:Uncharacterized protein n=1 Tax=Trifolium medium TaxID=97028 RepID=A0A392RDC9_9FABA|nr:hypothetical protein [Trifolium medium]